MDLNEFNSLSDKEKSSLFCNTEILNKQVDLLFKYWDGVISEDEFEQQRLFCISEQVDRELQKDSYY